MRRSTLHCALAFAVAVLVYSFIYPNAAHGQTAETQGSMRVVNAEGKLTEDFLLKHTAVKAEVSGFISRVTVTQDFDNPYPGKIPYPAQTEAIYIFPLPPTAQVDDLTILIG